MSFKIATTIQRASTPTISEDSKPNPTDTQQRKTLRESVKCRNISEVGKTHQRLDTECSKYRCPAPTPYVHATFQLPLSLFRLTCSERRYKCPMSLSSHILLSVPPIPQLDAHHQSFKKLLKKTHKTPRYVITEQRNTSAAPHLLTATPPHIFLDTMIRKERKETTPAKPRLVPLRVSRKRALLSQGNEPNSTYPLHVGQPSQLSQNNNLSHLLKAFELNGHD